MLRKIGEGFVIDGREEAGSGASRNGRARFLTGASAAALASASVAAALGVSMASPAHAAPNMTVNPVQATTYTQNANNNPITFGGTTNINGLVGPGIFGGGNATWNDTLLAGGQVIGATDGVYLNTAGSSFTWSRARSKPGSGTSSTARTR